MHFTFETLCPILAKHDDISHISFPFYSYFVRFSAFCVE